ncbi:CST complex subunit TEN1 isoform X2 [Stegostoma tigrinum]|uniref:CST complex subunit TEN1 isoform X2 n=1 Tax=Stegostoma tigrinum TaxID=3053191 RepID=UPI0028701F77|nr:CST complex subunit TEN1 isoform X2 [Stegostoma tigrinum]
MPRSLSLSLSGGDARSSRGFLPAGSLSIQRLTTYDARISEAILSVHHSSTDYQLRVRTSLVEPFEARIGSEYMVLGEIETSAGNIPVIQARLLMDADGVNLPLLERAVQEQRKYFQQRAARGALETGVETNKRDV